MTREEAINEINKVFTSAYANYIVTALTEGATVSDKEPTTKNDLGIDWENYKDVDGNSLDDLILEVLQNNFDCGNTYGYKVADEIIGLLPSVTPQEPRWIPVTERLPEKQDEYLVTWTAEAFRDKPFIQIIEFDIEDRAWILKRYMKEMYRSVTITAWMPLLEPYKGGKGRWE